VGSYPTFSPLPPASPERCSPEAVSFLCHFPSAFAAWGFPSVLPCGVRTFLGARRRRGHPACGHMVATRYRSAMDPDRARELLAGERTRIERALAQRAHADTGEEADDLDPGNLASELYQDELDEGLTADLREVLAAVERAEERLAAGTYGLSVESGKPIPDERLQGRPPAGLTVEQERTLHGDGY